MLLVDTSVLIDFLRGRNNRATDRFEQVLADGMPFGINFYVYQEILQGAASEREYAELKRYLDTQVFYSLRRGRESHERAARLYFDCRQAGQTVAGVVDCLIAQTAIENNLYLLHNDSDFDRIASVARNLKIY